MQILSDWKGQKIRVKIEHTEEGMFHYQVEYLDSDTFEDWISVIMNSPYNDFKNIKITVDFI